MKRRTKVSLLFFLLTGIAFPMTSEASGENSPYRYEFPAVVVTANRIPENLVDTKADISVVGRKQIESLHLQTVEAALRIIPGTQFLNYGANGLNANLSGIRINGSKDIVVLIDGVRISDFQGADNAGYMYSSILSNMDNIERVEVLRGSAATKYGSGAKGGVINIITRKIDRTKQTVDVSVGTQGRRTYRLDSMGRFDKFGYNAYFNKLETGDTKAGDGKKWPGRTKTNSGGLKLAYDWNKDHSLAVYYDELSSQYRGKDFVYRNRYHGDYKVKSVTMQDSWKINSHWSNELSYRNSKIKSNYYQDYETQQSPYSISGDNTYDFISEQIHFTDAYNELVFGLDYSKGVNHLPISTEQYDEDGNPILARGHYQKNYSYFIQEDWKFMPRWTLSGGIRYDRPSSDNYSADMKNHVSKSYKLSFEITDKDTIFAGKNDFYILPGLDKIYARWADPDDPDAGVQEHGNRDLKPAEGTTRSVGYTHKFNEASAFTFNWFKTKNTRTIGYSYEEGHYVNYNFGLARGWNAQFIHQLSKDWRFDIGWAHLYQKVPGDNLAMGYYPKDKITFDLIYTHEKWQVGVDGFYFIRKKNPAYAAYKGWPHDKYGIYNLAINYSPNKEATIYVKVDNIFDTLWAEHTDVVHHGKPESWYSMPGRTISFGGRFTF